MLVAAGKSTPSAGSASLDDEALAVLMRAGLLRLSDSDPLGRAPATLGVPVSIVRVSTGKRRTTLLCRIAYGCARSARPFGGFRWPWALRRLNRRLLINAKNNRVVGWRHVGDGRDRGCPVSPMAKL